MEKIVEYEIDGQKVFIEGNLPDSGSTFVSDGNNTVITATNSFGQAMEPVMTFAKDVITRISNINIRRPAEIELEFGIKLSGAVNFWVITGNGEGTINLKLTWKTASV